MEEMKRLVRLLRDMEDELGDVEDKFLAVAVVALIGLWIVGVVLHWW
tara:strand:- start:2749 stop:2889 length:141 start_codon:yes stop_codon:yes gene_type:complete